MKFKYYAYFIVLMLSACNKKIEVSEPDFSVSTEATTFKVSEEVKFKINGDANYIAFYSGEEGRNYEVRDGRVINVENEPVYLSFTSSVQGGTQANQLSVLASTDFNGDYSSLTSVKSATWTDITSRFTLGTTSTFFASGERNIADLMQSNRPIYIAFKYLTRPQAANGLVRTWMVQTFNMTSAVKFKDQNIVLTDQILAGFRIVDEDAINTPARSLITSTRVTLQGNVYKNPADPIYNPDNPIYDPANPLYDPESPSYDPKAVRPTFVPYNPASPYNDPTRENWAVSAPVYANKVSLGSDLSIPIKGLTSGKLDNFTYSFSKSGIYTVYFIATNESVDEKKEIKRSITLTITD